MKNKISDGGTVNVTAPYAVSAGDGALVGSLFGVSVDDAANGADLVIVTAGVFELAKLSAQAWTVGALIYWDDTNKEATTVSTANTLIGVAHAAAANPSAVGEVRLNGSFTQ